MEKVLEQIISLMLSLSVQFLLAGGLVMAGAAYLMGSWVTERIEEGVVENTGISAALYIEGLLPHDVFTNLDQSQITDETRAALQKVFREGIVSERIATYNVWGPNGLVIDSHRPELVGRTFEVSDDLQSAWNGNVASGFEKLEVHADQTDIMLGVPLLEVYVPVRDTQTGQVIVVVEFYQHAATLEAELLQARGDTWELVFQIFFFSGLLLFSVVLAGDRLIGRQRVMLENQLNESRQLSRRVSELRTDVLKAAQRSTAQSERIMQRIGQDLHDGVAQHLSLASLRLEGAGLAASQDAETVTNALGNAMTELRAISRGLALPDLERLGLVECAKQAVDDHNKNFTASVTVTTDMSPQKFAPLATNIGVYRFIQEALSNVHRHADATDCEVTTRLAGDSIVVTVSDNGKGFDPDKQIGVREDGGQGIPGLMDRAATLDGKVTVVSRPGDGTKIELVLPMVEVQQ